MTAAYGLLTALCLGAYSAADGFSHERHARAELDRRVDEDIELATRAIVLEEGRPGWAGGILGKEVEEEEGGGHWTEVWSLSGERLLSAGTVDPIALGPAPTVSEAEAGAAKTVRPPFGPVRVRSQLVTAAGHRFIVRAAVSEAATRAQVRSVWIELAVISASVLSLGGLGGWALARRVLSPLSSMASRARRITAEQLDGRIDVEPASAEMEQLRDAFNETLSRLEGSFEHLRRFTADAAHELRTPLTALRSVGEVGLRSAQGEEELREVIGTMLEVVDHLARLAGDLLALARAESGQAPLRLEPLDLAALAREVCESLLVLAEERGQVLDLAGVNTVEAQGDRVALRLALMNLVDNAIKYGPEGSRVAVSTGRSGTSAWLEVADDGPGIAREHHENVFERFYRVDVGRSRASGGTGLGLALVKWTATAHGGRVELDSEPGRGSRFRILLPARPRGT
jgi:heavy metal sensor kinase